MRPEAPTGDCGRDGGGYPVSPCHGCANDAQGAFGRCARDGSAREARIAEASERIFADADGCAPSQEIPWERMLEQEIPKSRISLVLQALTRFVREKAGIHFGQRIPKLERAEFPEQAAGWRSHRPGSPSATIDLHDQPSEAR